MIAVVPINDFACLNTAVLLHAAYLLCASVSPLKPYELIRDILHPKPTLDASEQSPNAA